MMFTRTLLNMLATTLLLAGSISPSVEAYTNYTYVPGAVCQAQPGRGVNTMSRLPMVTHTLSSVSKDWASYSLVSPCSDDEAEVCFFVGDDPLASFMSNFDSPEQTSFFTAIEGIAVYAGVGALMYVLSVLAILCAPCCLCCCRRKKTLTAIQPDDGTIQFKRNGRGCCILGYALLAVFIVFSLGVIAGGDLNGNRALTGAQTAIAANVPEDAAELVLAFPTPVEDFIIDVVGGSLVKGVESINKTFSDAVDMASVHESFLCLNRILDIASPARLGYFVDVLSGMGTSILALPQGNATSDAFRGLDSSLTALLPGVDAVAVLVGNLSDGLAALDTAAIRTALENLNHTLHAELSPTLVDLKTQVASMTANETRPPEAAEVATSVSYLTAFRDSPTSATANALVADLQTMADRLERMTDTAALASTVQTAGTVFDGTQASLAALVSVLDGAQNQLAQIPDAAAANATINQVSAAIASFDMQSVVDALAALDVFIGDLPNVNQLSLNILALANIEAEVPCVLSLGSVISRVNDSLLALPESMNGISDVFDGLNASVADSIGELDGMNGFMDTLNDTLGDLPDVGSYIASVRDQSAQMNSSRSQLDTVKAEVADMGGSVDGANFTETITQIQNLQAELSNSPARLNASELDTMRELNTTRGDSITNIREAVAIVQLWESQFGASGFAGVCPDNTPCGPGAPGTPCSDEQCSYAEVKAKIDSTVTKLDSFSASTASQPSFGDLLAGLDAAIANVAAVPPMDTAALNDLDGIIADLLPKLADYRADMEALKSDLQGTLDSLDIAGLISQWEEVQSMVDTLAADLVVYSDGVKAMNSTLAAMTGEDSMLQMALTMEVRLNDLIVRDLERHLDLIRVPALRAQLGQGGLRAVLDSILLALDRIMGFADDPPAPGQAPPPGALTAMLNGTEATLAAVFRVLDLVKSEAPAIHEPERGPIDYLVTISAPLFEEPLVKGLAAPELESGTLTVWGAFHGGRVEDYPDGQLCLTSECIHNTAKVLNQETGGLPGLPLSREMALRLPYAIPIFIALLALLTLCAPCTSCPLAVCILFTMPTIFLIAGVLLFPVVMSLGLFCAAAEPLAVSLAADFAPTLCDTLGGALNGYVCTLPVNVSAAASPLQVPLDLEQIAEGLLMRECVPGEGLDLAYSGTAQSLETTMQELLTDQIGGFGLKQDLRSDIETLGADVGRNTADLVRGIGGVLDCRATNDFYAGVKDAVCCNLVGSIYVFVSSWYLLGFGMMCCGLPGTCIACKYFKKPDMVLPVRK